MQEAKNDKNQKEKQDVLSNNTEEEQTELNLEEFNGKDVPKIELSEKSQIYLVELIFIFPILILADIFDILSLTGVGVVLSWGTDIIATGVTTLWLWWKGRRAEWNLIANLIEFIPVVDVLPWRTTMMILLLVKDSKVGKQALSKIEKVSDKNRAKLSSSNIINISNKEDINNQKAA